MAETVRWSLEISKDADASLRSYLAQHGLADRDASVPAEEIEAAIEEVLHAVRGERFRE
jgi:ribbon-helix-helix protein